MMVASTAIKITFFPGKLNLAKMYPDNEQKKRLSMQIGRETTTLLRKYLAKGIVLNNCAILSNRHLTGSQVGGQTYVSGKDLNAVKIIQIKGKTTIIAARIAMT